jgi:hypothetical protein
MRHFLLGISATIGLASTAAAETPLMAPIHQFVDSMGKGDEKAAASAFAPTGVVIIDEIPPYLWVGAHPLQQWSKDLASASRTGGITSEMVTLGKATREDINGNIGYVVVPADFTFKQKGVAMSETAEMVYTLKQSSGRWLITGWTWVGGTSRPASVPSQ